MLGNDERICFSQAKRVLTGFFKGKALMAERVSAQLDTGA